MENCDSTCANGTWHSVPCVFAMGKEGIVIQPVEGRSLEVLAKQPSEVATQASDKLTNYPVSPICGTILKVLFT